MNKPNIGVFLAAMAQATKRKTPERRVNLPINIKITLGSTAYISFGFEGPKLQVMLRLKKDLASMILFFDRSGFARLLRKWDAYYVIAKNGYEDDQDADYITDAIDDFRGRGVSITPSKDRIRFETPSGIDLDLRKQEIDDFQEKLENIYFQFNLLIEQEPVIECMFETITAHLNVTHQLLHGPLTTIYLTDEHCSKFHRTKSYFASFKPPADVINDFVALVDEKHLTCKLNQYSLFHLCIAQDSYLLKCIKIHATDLYVIS